MGVWQNLTENTTRQIDEIIEKQKTMINNVKSSEIAQKNHEKDLLVYYGHQLDMDYHHMRSQ